MAIQNRLIAKRVIAIKEVYVMRSSKEIYHEVAERCHAYDVKEKKDCMCNMAEGEKSCLNCRHFADDEHCKLDLYDPIVKEL